MQVEKHWSSNEVPKMTLEKLQMVATCNTTSFHKVKFLKWWNSSMPSRDARQFPAKLVSETYLGPFLNKIGWYAGVSAYFIACTNFDIAFKFGGDIIHKLFPAGRP